MTSGVDAAPVRLVALSAADMTELAAGAATFRGWEVADGALPPDFIFDMALLALAAGADPLWAAPRAFVLDREGRVVGTGGYKGPPDAGRVEIGYGMAPAHRGRGYATAAVRAMVAEALAAPGVADVVAETAVGNLASQRVAEKAGFVRVGRRTTAEDGDVVLWRFAPPHP